MAAFVALSTVGDANATALLHWVLEHGTPETALEAALTLEELDLRREAQALMATVPVVSSAREAAAFERRPVKRRTTMTALRPNQSSVA